MSPCTQAITDIRTEFSRLRIYKNIAVLSLVFFMTYTAYEGLSMLQSTLNHEKGIGVICLALSHASLCISALILPKYIIKKFGSKITLIASIIAIIPYIASNLYPHWSLMVPATILTGSAAALLWSSQCQYLNELAVIYASIDCKSKCKKFALRETDLKNKYLQSEDGNKQNGVTCHSHVNSFADNENKNNNIKDLPPSDGEICNLNRDNNVNIYTNDKISFSGDPRVISSVTSQKIHNLSHKNVQSTTARFFGIHGMAFLSTHLCGNLMSYLVFQKDAVHSENNINSSCICGAHFCNEKSDCLVKNLQEPSQVNRMVFIGMCIGFVVISALLLAVFLDSLYDQKEKVEFSFEYLLATCRHLKKKNQIFLMPITFYVGMMQGFYTSDFNMAFVGCAWGTFHVGLVSMCYGASCAAASFLSGCMIKYVGRIPVITFAALLNVATLIVLLVWSPSAMNPTIFFLISISWGTSVGTFWSQLKAFYGFVFKNEKEAAFAAYHLWYSLGSSLSFAYSIHLCIYIKIYILISVLVLSIIGYLNVEIFLKQKLKDVEK